LPRIEFGAITPKLDHVLVNVAGSRVRSTDMEDFLLHRKVRPLLPRFNLQQLNYYEGRAPVRHARHVSWDRFVAVGDATGWLRPFKGMGITTAIETGSTAADVMMERGIDGVALAAYGLRLRYLTEDHYHGRALRRLCRVGMNTGVMDGVIELAKTNQELYTILYDTISGQYSYRRIARDLLRSTLFFKMGALTIKRVLRLAG
jgi:flavin-dependent dehydrogenase